MPASRFPVDFQPFTSLDEFVLDARFAKQKFLNTCQARYLLVAIILFSAARHDHNPTVTERASANNGCIEAKLVIGDTCTRRLDPEETEQAVRQLPETRGNRWPSGLRGYRRSWTASRDA